MPVGCVGMPKRVKKDIVRVEPEKETLKRFKKEIQTMIMKSCRDCYYGCISFDFGIVSCLKYRDLYYPEQANICKYYESTSIKEAQLWRVLIETYKHDKVSA